MSAQTDLTVQKIVPNIWCNRNAEEAAAFYVDAFEQANFEIESRYPETGLAEFQREFAGDVLTIGLDIAGYRLALINAGNEFTPNPAISFMLNFDPLFFDGDSTAARAGLDRLWKKLSDGGKVLMPLGRYHFNEHYGWIEDRFGVSWQLMLTDPAGEPRPFMLPAFMFGSTMQNHAGEAVGHYLDVFADMPDGAELGAYVLYPEKQGPAEPGTVQFSVFRLGDQWFVAMDAGAEEPFDFTAGVSLEVRCDDQEEIDRIWVALSASPEAEQCGWLADRFGVSWQIVPENLGDLMERPGAFEKLMQMKKIVIADF